MSCPRYLQERNKKEGSVVSAHIRRLLPIVMALSLIAVFTSSVSAQAIAFHSREIVPFELVDIGCNGEAVFFSGELLLISQTTFDSRGGVHYQDKLVPKNVRGVGSLTGAQYKAVGGDRAHFNAASGDAPYNFTETSMYKLVSQGSSDNLQIKLTLHTTVNAKGETTSEVEHFSSRCGG